MVILNFTNNNKIRQYFLKYSLLLAYISLNTVGAQNKDFYVSPNISVSGLQNIYVANNIITKQTPATKSIFFVDAKTTVSGLNNISNAKIVKAFIAKKTTTKLTIIQKKHKVTVQKPKTTTAYFPFKENPYKKYSKEGLRIVLLLNTAQKKIRKKTNLKITSNLLKECYTKLVLQKTPKPTQTKLSNDYKFIAAKYSRPPPNIS
jgi:hypothetical protein